MVTERRLLNVISNKMDDNKMLQCISEYEESYKSRLHLITTNHTAFAIDEKLIWISPIYNIVIPAGLDEYEEQIYKEIFIDVTNSAPRFAEPQEQLSSVLDVTLELIPKSRTPMILDFGAGKLRNTLYLLKKGLIVHAVEFEKMKDEGQAKSMYEQAKKYEPKFHRLVFAHEFFNSSTKFDLILLVNVCSIMPVPSERLLVLQYCREKLTEKGMILWYTLHKDYDYVQRCKPEVAMGDGYYINATKRFQTFYRDFESYEIDSMFFSTGFRLEKKFQVPHIHARLYRKVGDNPIKNTLDADLIRDSVSGDVVYEAPKRMGVQVLKSVDNPTINIPNPTQLREESLYMRALKNLPTGGEYATEYHHLISAILIKLLMPPLENPIVEQGINDGRKRIDIVITNHAKCGFFNNLTESYNIHAPLVFIECKNYEKTIGEKETAQISGRLSPRRGMFGILTYRKIKDSKRLWDRCTDLTKDKEEYILPLNDDDIILMLNLKLENEEIDEYLDNKMRRLLLD